MSTLTEPRQPHLELLFDDDENDTCEWWMHFLNQNILGLDAPGPDAGGHENLAAANQLGPELDSGTALSSDSFVFVAPLEHTVGSPSTGLLPTAHCTSSPASSPPLLGPSKQATKHSSPQLAQGKRKQHDDPFIICFPANPKAPNGAKKRRKDFDDRRRREVADVRKIRACNRCKLRKVPCDTQHLCGGCVMAAGPMAAFICSRKTFRETRVASPDLLAIEHTKRVLGRIESFRQQVEGSRRTLSLRIGSYLIQSSAIPVVAQQYGPAWLTSAPLQGTCVPEVGDTYEYVSHSGSPYMLINPPDVDTLVSLVESQFLNTKKSIGFANSMDTFVTRYSQGPDDLPLKTLVRDVHRLSCLVKMSFSLVYFGDDTNNDGSTGQPSACAQDQVAMLAKVAAIELELKVLGALDSLLFGNKGTGAKSKLALWACLWTLIHQYRMLTRFFDGYRQLPGRGSETWAGHAPYDLEMAKHMYHHLVSVYASLFKSTTPLYLDWRLGENRELFSQDEGLIRAFQSLRTETMYFHQGSRWLTSPEDRFLKRMVLDQEIAMDPRTAGERRNSRLLREK